MKKSDQTLVGPQATKEPPKLVQNEAGQFQHPDGVDPEIWGEQLQSACGTLDGDLVNQLLNQVSSSVRPADSQLKQLNTALAALHGIGPRDELEAMLAAQMIGTHNLAMEFIYRSFLEGLTMEAVAHNVNRATQLMKLFRDQVRTLSRYRGQAQQTVTVEHVHVNEGGQAIVGAVSGGGTNEPDK